MGVHDVAGEDVGGPELLVVHDLNAEIHLGHAGRLDHVQPHLVLEDPDRARRPRAPQEHVVVVLHGVDVRNTRQNGLRTSAIAGIVVDLDAAQADLQVRGQKRLVELDAVLEAGDANLLACRRSNCGSTRRTAWQFASQVFF